MTSRERRTSSRSSSLRTSNESGRRALIIRRRHTGTVYGSGDRAMGMVRMLFACAEQRQSQGAVVVRYSSIVRRRPSTSSTFGSQPSNRRASVMSGWRT